ncbi:hypothetical protein H206_01970 [Candidatus Electrothrix aarhusensis]|uniref:Uncharacterized protein n=1 Tax=Candidatus Electrothrix aarhusensis TaxID=1859131 RepID=A0A444ITN5_9BACT|nr:hypothetical protein H206_01970 [Candidatus Electrothrix aarhusensis]
MVFHNDWGMTIDCIIDGSLIDGTFIEPGMGDESNNWSNRGELLKSYRNLLQLMKQEKIKKQGTLDRFP